MSLLVGKVAVVTGAGRGIGRGEAIELARQGAAVVVNELDAEAGEAVVAEIQAAGGAATLHTGDCSEVEGATTLIGTALETFGRVDALVNNAGILRDRTIVKMSVEEWDAVIKVHLRGHFLRPRSACAHWKELGQPGRIVCTASTSGLLGNFGQTNYGAAKAGIAAFAAIVAQEMARYGVTCNAIAPAARTRMTEGAYGDIFSAGAELRLLAPGQRRADGGISVLRRQRAHQRQDLRCAGRRGRALPAVHVLLGHRQRRLAVGPRGARRAG